MKPPPVHYHDIRSSHFLALCGESNALTRPRHSALRPRHQVGKGSGGAGRVQVSPPGDPTPCTPSRSSLPRASCHSTPTAGPNPSPSPSTTTTTTRTPSNSDLTQKILPRSSITSQTGSTKTDAAVSSPPRQELCPSSDFNVHSPNSAQPSTSSTSSSCSSLSFSSMSLPTARQTQHAQTKTKTAVTSPPKPRPSSSVVLRGPTNSTTTVITTKPSTTITTSSIIPIPAAAASSTAPSSLRSRHQICGSDRNKSGVQATDKARSEKRDRRASQVEPQREEGIY
ncbi:hypothetical protein E2C01_000761 [Portunus trituberculatus]|uniref:Uncharacterized protein n=1 Tax=Portunus trituberculatus TaxID=210409 RepID=A0A5B7CHG0_PORTR|nr:hypothetical protein [Portunus trituberculatus]